MSCNPQTCPYIRKLYGEINKLQETYLKVVDDFNRKIERLRLHIQLLENNNEEQTSSEGERPEVSHS